MKTGTRSTILPLALLAVGFFAIAASACSGDEDLVSPADGGPIAVVDASSEPGDGAVREEPDATSDAGPSTPRAACESYLRAAYQRMYECGTGTETPEPGAWELDTCPERFFLEGATRTIESLQQCAEQYRTQPCDEVRAGITPACATAGTRAGGEPCQTGSQCASLNCLDADGNRQSDFQCGTCQGVSTPGSPCQRHTCSVNFTCDSTDHCQPLVVPTAVASGAACPVKDQICGPNDYCSGSEAAPGTCRPYLAAGGDCSNPEERCSSDLMCFQGRCQAERRQLGESCEHYANCAAGLTCLDAKCVARQSVPLGGVCTGSDDCVVSAFCRYDGTSPNTCTTRTAVGASCTQTDECTSDAFCPEPTTAVPVPACTQKAPLGGDCSRVPCVEGHVCEANVCRARGAAEGGAACTYDADCARPRTCNEGRCTLAVCQR